MTRDTVAFNISVVTYLYSEVSPCILLLYYCVTSVNADNVCFLTLVAR